MSVALKFLQEKCLDLFQYARALIKATTKQKIHNIKDKPILY